MVYLNNAATSYPKPACVQQAVCGAMGAPPREGGRGTLGAGDAAEDCRRALAPLLGVEDPGRLFFTSGATESFNLILRGLNLAGRPVVATAAEHNALLRPLYALCGAGDIHILPLGPDGRAAPKALDALPPGTACVFVNHCSNVTGDVQNLPTLARAAHKMGALLVADVSQSAGMMPVLAGEWGVDILVFTGHKALFGPTGTGGFYLRPGLALPPAKWGGTGTEGDSVTISRPDMFEVGTQNLLGLEGLTAGAGYVARVGLDVIARRVDAAVARLRRRLGELPNVRLYGGDARPHGAALAFNVAGLAAADVGYILQHSYDIVVRTGHHCAPLMGRAMGAPNGSVRASLSWLTTDEELDAFVQAVAEIAEGAEGL